VEARPEALAAASTMTDTPHQAFPGVPASAAPVPVQAGKPSRRAPGSLLLAALSLVLTAAPGAGCRTAPAVPPPPHFTFVQMGDPQLGMGGYEADLKRFEQAVRQINELHPDFVVICGDLVNRTDRRSFAAFNAIRNELTVPCYCAPGNHDVGNTPTPQLLRQYRQCVGKDYFAFEYQGCAFIVANTQLWKAPLAGESETHDRWFKRALAHAGRKHQPIFVVAHYPLFVSDPDEADNYYNLPLEKRQELLAAFRRCGVVGMLAGHTHTTIIREVDGIQMVASQNTCKNFDRQPFGFRVWHVGAAPPYRHEFVPLTGQP
jgi:serine/threonine-protein phosphatase CPPED1